MRLRRRVSDSMQAMIVPAVCCAVIAYFGYNGVFGPRGLFAWSETEAELAIKRHELADVKAQRKALEHRISLLDEHALDPDLLGEVARKVLSEGRPGEVVVPRAETDENHQ
jgi:cell division protein FtsB